MLIKSNIYLDVCTHKDLFLTLVCYLLFSYISFIYNFKDCYKLVLVIKKNIIIAWS